MGATPKNLELEFFANFKGLSPLKRSTANFSTDHYEKLIFNTDAIVKVSLYRK